MADASSTNTIKYQTWTPEDYPSQLSILSNMFTYLLFGLYSVQYKYMFVLVFSFRDLWQP